MGGWSVFERGAVRPDKLLNIVKTPPICSKALVLRPMSHLGVQGYNSGKILAPEL
jgi:hypothetical protein